MMLLCVFAIITLELMAISLGLGASGAPKMTPCPLNVQISLIVASIFHIPAVYGPIGLCFGYDAPVGFWYLIFKTHGPITRSQGRRVPNEFPIPLKWVPTPSKWVPTPKVCSHLPQVSSQSPQITSPSPQISSHALQMSSDDLQMTCTMFHPHCYSFIFLKI